MNKQKALAQFVGCKKSDIDESSYDDSAFEYGRTEFLVLTDDEADERAKQYISDSLWAFNSGFLADFTGLPEEVFAALQPQCESANEAILALVDRGDGIEYFAEQAISADGRGHFMSSYDGAENEQGDYFIYRTN